MAAFKEPHSASEGNTSIQTLLDPNCGIPPDVLFEIVDSDGKKCGEALGGHKNLLALKSDVFKAMFFGPLKEEGVIKLHETSDAAFMNLIRYTLNSEDIWTNSNLKTVFETAELAERFQMQGLQDQAVSFMEGVEVCQETWFHAASLAEQFHLLPPVSEALLNNCASFLKKTFKTPDDFNEFSDTYSKKEDGLIAFRLLARIDMNDIVTSSWRAVRLRLRQPPSSPLPPRSPR